MNARIKILVVEDDRDTLLGLSIALTKSGYEVIRAEDGTMALQIAARQNPDLILLDLGLPGGDGFFVLETLQRNLQLQTIKVFVVSARDAIVNQARALGAGAQAYFEKPIEISDLLAAIASAFSPVEAETFDHDRLGETALRGTEVESVEMASVSKRIFTVTAALPCERSGCESREEG
ncbi:MAG: response regulator transcription factor [Verrucomicrobiae bacterium]|nr:response regulator transcription factor [Verrucomicrobiae bacterium]